MSDMTSTSFAASVKYHPGAWKLAGVLNYGTSKTSTTRNGFFLEELITQSEMDRSSVSLLMAISYDFEWERSYLRPALELGYHKLDTDGTLESGPLALFVEQSSETFTWIRPHIESGYESTLESGSSVRFFGRLGVKQYIGDEFSEVRAGLDILTPEIDPILTRLDAGQTAAELSTGLDWIFKNDMVLKIQYDYSSSDAVTMDSGFIKLTMPF